MPETLLALLLRPEMLDTGSVKGIVPPLPSVCSFQASERPRIWLSKCRPRMKRLTVTVVEDEEMEGWKQLSKSSGLYLHEEAFLLTLTFRVLAGTVVLEEVAHEPVERKQRWIVRS